LGDLQIAPKPPFQSATTVLAQIGEGSPVEDIFVQALPPDDEELVQAKSIL